MNQNKIGNSIIERSILFVLFLFGWIYIWLRAYKLPLFYDEITTFFTYVQTNNFIPFHAPLNANNHILNSALTTLFCNIFGVSKICIRLANILAYPVYCFFVYKISLKISNKILQYSLFLTLCFTHNVTEYFALSRGYALSIALLITSIYFLIKNIENKNKKLLYSFLSLFFAILSSFASLVILTSYLIIIFILIILTIDIHIKTKENKNYFYYLYIIILGIIPFVYLFKYANKLKECGLIVIGSLNGFWEVSVKSISNLLCPSFLSQASIIFSIIFLFCIVSFIVLFFKNELFKSIFNHKYIFLYILFANIIAIFLSGNLLKINYPEGRAALYLFPLLISSFIFIIDELIINFKFKSIKIIVVVLFIFPYTFFRNLNFTLYDNYISSYIIPESFYNKIISEQKNNCFPPTIGSKIDNTIVDFFNYTNAKKISVLNSWNTIKKYEDFQICTIEELPNWNLFYNIIDEDKETGLCLFKRIEPLKKELILKREITINENSRNEFSGFLSISNDSLKLKALYIGFDFTIFSDSKPFQSFICVEIRDKKGKNIRYTKIDLSRIRYFYNGEKSNLLNGILIDGIPENSDEITAYIWNNKKEKFKLNGNLSLFKIM